MLVDKYVGSVPGGDPDTFFANMQTEPRLLFRIEPEDRINAVRAIDMRIYRGKRFDRDHQSNPPN